MNIRESVVHTLRCESEIIAELEKRYPRSRSKSHERVSEL